MSVKITSLELENVKRIKAVSLSPSPSGLTVIGGRNGQGKTSVLDAIAWALGGGKYRPSQPRRADGPDDPRLSVTLSNGLTVTRSGKNAALKVTDPSGQKGGQQLLNSFLSELALDLPKFLSASDKDKASTLLQIIGVGDTLARLDSQEADLYAARHYTGQQYQTQAKLAEGLPYVEGAPEAPVSAAELLRQHQEVLLSNAENQRKRDRAAALARELTQITDQIDLLRQRQQELEADLEIARTDARDLEDRSTQQIEERLRQIDQINRDVELNRRKREAQARADQLQDQYRNYTAQIEEVRRQRTALLDAADLPLPGLSVEQGALTYQGQRWDCLSGADQLRIAVAIVRRLNPNCGFVLVDKLEQMDLDTLHDFGAWLEEQDLQAIVTRVSTGGECSIIIEDGLSAPSPAAVPPEPDSGPASPPSGGPRIIWTPGKF